VAVVKAISSALRPLPKAEQRKPLISVENVSYTYPNGTVAIRDVSFDIDRNVIYAVIGPSGCGKSTLLSILAGLTTPSQGTTTEDFASQPNVHPRAIVAQKDAVLPWLTVERNVGMYLSLRGDRAAAVRRAVAPLLRLGKLESVAQAYPYQLSGGMRRRVGFLMALAAKPQLLLLDEPFSALDEPTRVKLHQDLLPLVRSSSAAVLLVTHDLAEAISLSDRVIMLSPRPGRIERTWNIPFGVERNMLELRQSPEFLGLYGELWRELSRVLEEAEGNSK
jgi:NitT/TauT family transport system ATP-binding protein